MTDIKTRIKNGFQGAYMEEKPFILVGIVREDMASQITNKTNISDPLEKAFILCSCDLKDDNKTLLYLSNDPNDYIYNNLYLSNNRGVVPLRKEGEFLKLDINKNHKSETINFPKNNPFDIGDKINLSEFTFRDIDSDSNITNPYFGTAYKINHVDDGRINFYVRKNVSSADTGRSGPPIAKFQTGTFEALNTISYASQGISFTYNEDNKILGLSRLVETTPSKPFTSVGATATHNTGIIELEQNGVKSYNVFHNFGISDIYLDKNQEVSFLGTTTKNPDPTNGGLSVVVNIRNSLDNFISIDNIMSGVTEVFDYYFLNPTDFTSGGVINNSRQYLENNGDFKGGVSYYFDKTFFHYESIHGENTKGLVHILNILNNTAFTNVRTDSNKVTDFHSSGNTVYSTRYESLKALNLNHDNFFNPGDGLENARIYSKISNPSMTHPNAIENLSKENKPIFTTNAKTGEQSFLVEYIILGFLLFVFIIFTIYYLTLKIE